VETARAEIAAALKMAEESGQHEGVVWARCGAAEVAALGGDMATARRELQRALSTYDAGGFTPPQVRAIVLTALACVDLVEGDLGTARRRLDSAITLALAPHDMPILAGAVHVLAGHTMLSGDPEQAAVLLGMATTLRGVRDQGSPDLLRTEDRVREQLGSEAYDRAYAEGAGLAREEAIARVRPASFQPPGQSGSGGGALAGQHLT
jgi:ATP/maltotriose-dependent transcriptional regulator MalT